MKISDLQKKCVFYIINIRNWPLIQCWGISGWLERSATGDMSYRTRIWTITCYNSLLPQSPLASLSLMPILPSPHPPPLPTVLRLLPSPRIQTSTPLFLVLMVQKHTISWKEGNSFCIISRHFLIMFLFFARSCLEIIFSCHASIFPDS